MPQSPTTPEAAGGLPAPRLHLLAAVIAHDDGAFVDRVQRALQLAADLLGYEIGLLNHVDGETFTVSVAHAPGNEVVPGTRLHLGDTFCSLTIERGDLVEIGHAEASEYRLHPCHTASGIESYVGIPVLVDDEPWGTLSFSSPRPRPSPLHAPDHDLIRLLAIWIGGVLEREMRDHRLSVQAGQLRSVVDQAPIVVYGLDAEARFTLFEGAGLTDRGLAPIDVVGRCLFDLYPDEGPTHAAVRRVLAGEPQSWEAVVGEDVFICRARPVRGPDGAVSGVTGVALDVTEQVRNREALAESEARFRGLSGATFEGIAYSEAGRVFDSNDQFARLFGFQRAEDVIGVEAEDLVAPEYRDVVARMMREERQEPYEAVCVRRDGSRFWAEIQGRRIPYDGRTVRVTAVRDISIRKRAEEQRRIQADMLAEVSDAIVALDLDGRVTYWNRGAEALHGRPAEEVLGRPLEETVQYLLPEAVDDDPTEVEAETALQSEAARVGELVFVTPDGHRRFVSVSSSVLYDERGDERGLLAVSRDVTAQRWMSSRLRHQATHDALTGLPNRALFRERIVGALGEGAPFAVMFVDLDRFKVVNDSLGHTAGDRLLMEVADRLRRAVAEVPGAVVARLGGDEFGLLAPTLGVDPETLGQAVLERLDLPVDFGARAISPSASVGLVARADRYDDPGAILRDADTAMYAAKRDGRGRLAVFTEAMHEAAALRFGLEHDLRYAAARGQITPHFQPIVDLATGAVSGFESLVRWAHPELGLLLPGRFLPLAEETGLVADLDRWVLELTCAEVATWGAEALDAIAHVSVNCSDQTFLSAGLADHARAVADIAGLPPDRLVLELTERALVDPEAARDVVAATQRNGLGLAIDDFGAGYSSLGLLHALPVDALKIDRSFVSDLETSPAARAVVRAVVGLTNELGLRAVAEGVETPGQLRVLREAGTRFAQGFLFSPPVPPAEAREMLSAPPWADEWAAWVDPEHALHRA